MKNRVHTLALLAACAAAISTLSCGGEYDYEDDDQITAFRQPSICGVTDWQDVELYNGALGTTTSFVAKHQRPVGNLKWKNDLATRYTNPGNVNGVRWCSATLIAPDLMLTAGHCFDIDLNGSTWPRSNATGQAITPAQGATEMLVDFDYQLDANGVARAPTSFAIAELMEYRLGGMDYAIIRMNGTPGTQFGIAPVGAFPTLLNMPITIIQHPLGLMKKVHAGSIVSSSATEVRYATADTEGVSSGSGVLNNATGFITAVHTNAGCTVSGGSNKGRPITGIVPSSPLLAEIAFDTAKLMTALSFIR